MLLALGSGNQLIKEYLFMSISHTASGQVVDLLPAAASTTESRTAAIFKSNAMEVIRLTLPEGKTMAPHSVKGTITVQCLAGEINFFANGAAHRMQAGQLLWLEGGVEHSLTAVHDAQVLVTIAL